MLILFVAVCAGALTYTVRRSPSSSNEADKDLPVLKIGVTDNDPYVYVDTTGDYAGIDIDIAREACKRAESNRNLLTYLGMIAIACSKRRYRLSVVRLFAQLSRRRLILTAV